MRQTREPDVPARTSDLTQISKRVLSTSSDEGRSVVVGISGFGGAGKSTVAHDLSAHLPGSVLVPGDEFIRLRPPTTRSDDWSDMDRNRLLQQVLLPTQRGEAGRYQIYDWDTQTLGEWVPLTGSVVIVEGIGLFHPELVEHIDLRVWIDIDLDTATARGMWRDENVFRNPQVDLWEQVWKPNDADFFRRFQPDQAAHIIYSPSASR